jgi:hypothetical protein
MHSMTKLIKSVEVYGTTYININILFEVCLCIIFKILHKLPENGHIKWPKHVTVNHGIKLKEHLYCGPQILFCLHCTIHSGWDNHTYHAVSC